MRNIKKEKKRHQALMQARSLAVFLMDRKAGEFPRSTTWKVQRFVLGKPP
jgi:hypothetical protein